MEWLRRKLGASTGELLFWLFAILAVALVLSLAYCAGQSNGKSGSVIQQQAQEIEQQREVQQANNQAADQRVKDAVKAEQQTKELQDALKATDDPDKQRALRGCVILRQQGRDTSAIPACAGFAGNR
jgi:Flp pilus assembly protein TadB